MAADEPPYLTVGTDVSAKYKGAFCEAKIKKVNRMVKCKVTFKNNLGSALVPDDQVKGLLRIGADVEAKHPEKNQFLEATINKLQDYSQYTVVFDDGDETTLRRTSLCLKSGRHFAESPTLDQFPLTNPEHFGTPVIGSSKSKRKRRSTMNSASLDYDSSDEESSLKKTKVSRGKERDPDLGKVVCVDLGDRRKKDNWYPGLVVAPGQDISLNSKEEYLIRSFKDGKYYQVYKKDTREFTREIGQKVDNNTLKTAVEKAMLYYEKEELPPHWDKALYIGVELPSAGEESHDSDSDTSDDEPSEEKDRFVAQLYKFMDERGTPINKAPTVGNRDLNLYKLFKIMFKMGGYNRVTNQDQWKLVYSKMGLPPSNPAGSNQIKLAYKRYLHSFEDFNRKLGCTMVTNSRSTRVRHRSDRNFIITRNRDRVISSTKAKITNKDKEKCPGDKKSEDGKKSDSKMKSDETGKQEEKVKLEKKKNDKTPKSEEKEEKGKLKKEEERPRLVRSQSINKDKKELKDKEEEKKDSKPEKARTREDARKEKTESPEKKETRSSVKIELEREKKEKEEVEKKEVDQGKDKKERLKDKEVKGEKLAKKDERELKENKEDKSKEKKEEKFPKDKKAEKFKDKKQDKSFIKEKKDEKSVKDKKEDKSPIKEKKDDKLLKDKKEDKLEEKIIKNKKEEKPIKDKKEEKVMKAKKEEKPVEIEVKAKEKEEKHIKDKKESKQIKDNKKEEKMPKEEEVVVIKKDECFQKEKKDVKPLKEKTIEILETEIILVPEDKVELNAPEAKESEDGDTEICNSDNKRPPGKMKSEYEELQIKQMKKRLNKVEEEEEDKSWIHSNDSDDDDLPLALEKMDRKDYKEGDVEIGDKVKVKYGRGRTQKVYEAKVLKVEKDGTDKKYYVHYAGWNMRYDEWVRKSSIVENMSERNRVARKKKQILNAKAQALGCNFLTQMQVKQERGRSCGPVPASKLTRKSSSSSTNSSVVSCSRTTRSDKNSLSTSPYSGGLEPRKRTRKKSGVSALTDTSQDSESDMDNMMLDPDDDGDEMEETAMEQNVYIKEEILSDEDETKDDMQSLNILRNLTEHSFQDVDNDFKDESNDITHDDRCPPVLSNENMALEPTSTRSVFICANVDLDKVMDKECAELVDCKKAAAKSIIKEPEENTVISETSMCKIKNDLTVFSEEYKNKLNSDPPKLKELYTDEQEKINIKGGKSNESKIAENHIEMPQNVISDIKESMFEEHMKTDHKEMEDNAKSNSPRSYEYCHDVKDHESENGKNILLEMKRTEYQKHDSDEEKKTVEKVERSLVDISSNDLLNEYDSEKERNSSIKPSVLNIFPKENEKTLGIEFIDEEPEKSEDSTQFKILAVNEPEPASFPSVTTSNIEDYEKQKVIEEKEGERYCDNKSISPIVSDNITEKINELNQNSSTLKIDSELKFHSTIIADLRRHENINDMNTLKCEDIITYGPEKETLSKKKCKKVSECISLMAASDSSFLIDSSIISADPSVADLGATDSKNIECKASQGSSITCPESLAGVKTKSIEVSNAENNTVQAEQGLFEEENENLQSSVIALAAAVATSVATAVPLPGPLVETKVNDSFSPPRENNPTVMPNLSSSVLSNSSGSVDDKMPKKSVEQKFVEEVFQNLEKRMRQEELILKNNFDKNANSCSLESVVSQSNMQNKLRNLTEHIISSPILNDCVALEHDNTENDDTNTGSDKSINLNETEPERPTESESSSSLAVDVDEQDTLYIKEQNKVIKPSESNFPVSMTLDKVAEMFLESHLAAEAERDETSAIDSVMEPTISARRESKKKRVKISKQDRKFCNTDIADEEDIRFKEAKNKSKKKAKFDYEDFEKFKDTEQKSRSKKLKKNKNKKRLSKSEDSNIDVSKKVDIRDDENKDSLGEKMRKKEKKRKEEKKFSKDIKSEEHYEVKTETSKKDKKKGKKRDKLSNEKRVEMMEKRIKKKKKMYCEENFESDSEKETKYSDMEKHTSRLSRKEKRKEKKKIKVKDTSSSDDGIQRKVLLTRDSCTEQNESLSSFVSQLTTTAPEVLHPDLKSDDPDMSFLLCEEKVPASPEGVNAMPDDTSGSSSLEELNSSSDRTNSDVDKVESVSADCYPRPEGIDALDVINKRVSEASTVLDNTPPTTPSSTESLLSSSPTHEREHFPLNYPESTRSGRESGEGESDSLQCEPGGTEITDSEEYRAAATLAFAVCKSVPMKTKDMSRNPVKHQKGESEELSPSKRRKKNKRLPSLTDVSKAASYGRHRSSLGRIKGDNFDDYDSCGANSVACASSSPFHRSTSTLSTHFTSALTQLNPGDNSLMTEPRPSKFNFYVPLHDCKDADKRISIIQDKLCELKRTYMALKAEVALIDRRRKKAKKKEKEAGSAVASSSAHVEESQCSS